MKKPVRKIISIIIGALLILIVALVLFINIYGDAALKAGVETGASKAMKVDVKLQDISLGILAGKLSMTDLVVDNPEGYSNPTFLELGSGFVHLKTSTLFSDTIEIETLKLDNVKVTIEQKGLTNNLKEILSNLPQSEAGQPDEEKTGKDLLIKKLDIEGVKVTVNLLPIPGRADNLTLSLAPIHMEDIGSGEHLKTPQLVSKILLAIAGGIAQQGADILPTEMITDITGQIGEQGKKILEAGQDIGKGVLDTGKNVGEQATEALKGLNPFQKKEEEK